MIVLAIDGLRASALGAYGDTWRPTPTLDRLACESLVCEWAFSATGRVESVYERLLINAAAGLRTRFATDDPAVAALPLVDRFDETTLVEPLRASEPASEIAATNFAASFAAFAGVVAEEAAGRPGLTWLHCRGFAGPWDAPTDLVQELVEPDDPTPPVTVAPANGQIDRQSDPDAVFIAACRYAAQVAVLDDCLASWLPLLPEEAVLVLLGLRGYALGEHGVVGLEEAGPYAESRHAPLLIRAPQMPPGVRWNTAPFEIERIGEVLARITGDATSQSPAAALRDSASELVRWTGPNHTGVRTLSWNLVVNRSSNASELYVKPDDRWEANDVASLREEVVDDLREQISLAER